jgi:hypothetical protein
MEINMDTKMSEALVLEGSDLRSKTVDLLNTLQEDSKIATMFARNPTSVIQSKLFPESFPQISQDQLGKANELLFSILDNKKFSNWLTEYQGSLEKQYESTGSIPEKKVLREDFANAIVEHGDARIVRSLLELNDRTSLARVDPRVADVAVEVETLIYVVDVAAVAVAVVAVALFGYARDPVSFKGEVLNAAQLVHVAQALVDNAKLKRGR